LINGGLGINTVQMTSAVTPTDADFAHMKSIEVLGLNGVSSVTLGANASAAGVVTMVTGSGNTSITDSDRALAVNAAALGAGALLTLAGSSADLVTGLTGNLSATSDSGALGVTTGATTALSIATGTGLSLIDASAMTSGDTLTLTGAHNAELTVGGNLAAGRDAGALIVIATGTGPQTIETGSGADWITARMAATRSRAEAEATASMSWATKSLMTSSIRRRATPSTLPSVMTLSQVLSRIAHSGML